MSAPSTPDSLTVFDSPKGQNAVLTAYQAVLNEWPVPFTESYVPTRFGKTHVVVCGPENAPVLVLLHALLASSAAWYRNVEALSQSYRVFAVDVIGEGNLSQPTRPIQSLDDFLTWFTELIDGLGIEALSLAGNSYGGFTAAYYAMKLPHRVKKVVLIGPASTISPMRPFYLNMFIPKMIFGFLPWLPGAGRSMRRSLDWMLDGLPRDPLWDEVFYQSMLHGGLINRVMPRQYTPHELAQIHAPVLLILGEKERIYNSLSEAQDYARTAIPHLEIGVIPNAHHITALSQPELVNQRMLKFLAA